MARNSKSPESVLRIERLNSEGQGVGSLDGLTCFVDGVLPGETARGRIIERKKNYARLAATEFRNPSPDRAEPPCPHYSSCGGCQLMHMNYSAQLAFKTKRVRDALLRIAKLPDPMVEPCLPAPNELHYRNKLQFHAQASAGGELAAGFYSPGSHRLVEIEECLVHSPLGQRIYSEVLRLARAEMIPPYEEGSDSGFLRHILLRSSEATGEALVVFVTRSNQGPAQTKLARVANALAAFDPAVVGVLQNVNERRGNTILGRDTRALTGRTYLREKLLGLEFHVSARSFFQVNTAQAERLFGTAIRAAGLSGRERVLDAYCGTGVLGLAVANRAASVVGVETNPDAVADAKANATRNGIENCRFLVGEAEELFRDVGVVDMAFLDPPRKGCEEKFLVGLAGLGPEKIVYVSCDPATLARDIAVLTKLGYQLERALPVDMFPQTAHVECIAILNSVQPR